MQSDMERRPSTRSCPLVVFERRRGPFLRCNVCNASEKRTSMLRGEDESSCSVPLKPVGRSIRPPCSTHHSWLLLFTRAAENRMIPTLTHSSEAHPE